MDWCVWIIWLYGSDSHDPYANSGDFKENLERENMT